MADAYIPEAFVRLTGTFENSPASKDDQPVNP
jgi:hypothetical protein